MQLPQRISLTSQNRFAPVQLVTDQLTHLLSLSISYQPRKSLRMKLQSVRKPFVQVEYFERIEKGTVLFSKIEQGILQYQKQNVQKRGYYRICLTFQVINPVNHKNGQNLYGINVQKGANHSIHILNDLLKLCMKYLERDPHWRRSCMSKKKLWNMNAIWTIIKISWILWWSQLSQLLFLATRVRKESPFDWFKSHFLLCKSQ